MTETVELEILVPVFNEEGSLQELHQELCSTLTELELEYRISFIDDGSKDDSWKLIEELAEKNSQTRGVRFHRNFGKESAIRAGLELCRTKALIVMDADLQHPPKLIPLMYKQWNDKQFLIVHGKKRSEKRSSILKSIGARLAYKLLSTFEGVELEGQSDFKLLDKEVVEFLKTLPEHKSFFRGMVEWTGAPSTSVEFEPAMRKSGNSGWSVTQLASLAIDMLTSFSTAPLRIVTFCSFLFMLFSVLLGAQTLIRYFSGAAVEGFTTVIICILLVGAVVSAALGIIGEYLGRVHEEIKSRPRYLIRESTEKKA